MSHQTKRSDYGVVVSRVADLLHLARFRWKHKLSPENVAHVAGLNAKTVRQLARENVDPAKQTQGYYFRTLERLCLYFGCQSVADLLWWYPPADLTSTLTPPELSIRHTPPNEPPTQEVCIQSRIYTWLEGKSRGQVAKVTGLDFQTVSDLMNPSHTVGGIKRRTLEALCSYLTEERGQPVNVHELLSCHWSIEKQESTKENS